MLIPNDLSVFELGPSSLSKRMDANSQRFERKGLEAGQSIKEDGC